MRTKAFLPLLLGLILTACSTSPGDYKDANLPTEERVKSLLSQMTLEEKIGQLLLYSLDFSKNITDAGVPADLDFFKAIHTGNVLNAFDEDLVNIQKELGENSRLGIPVMTMIDAINGHAFYPGTTIFPSQLALSHAWNEDLVYQVGRITAKEMAATGIHLNYGPGLDVARDLRWGRAGETFGEDTYLVGRLGLARVKGLQGEKLSDPTSVAACIKHFAGYGETEGGRDATETIISERHLRLHHLPPFELAIKEGKSASVMAGYQAVLGVPASANSWLLNDLLRDEFGFDGLVISDWENYNRLMDTHLVSEDSVQAASQIISAGNDLPMSAFALPKALKQAVDEGLIEEATIDQAVSRVLSLKFELGLFDQAEKRLPKENAKALLATAEHQEVALATARESLVLLSNKENTLPLDASSIKRIAVVGPNADDIVAQLGDWSLGFRGQGPWMQEVAERTQLHRTVLSALQEQYGNQIQIEYVKGSDVNDASFDEIAKARQAAQRADVVIAVIGDNRLLTGEQQDRARLDFTGKQMQMIEAVEASGKPLITVVLASKPLLVKPVVERSEATLLAINPGMKGGQAIVEVLFGAQNPSGKLTMSIPHEIGQVPMHYSQAPGWHGKGYYIDLDSTTKTPLFAFGHGLSYTNFTYSKLELENDQLGTGEALRGSFTVTNSGDRAGIEISQIYVQDQIASVVRPVRLLKGFKKTGLAVGESKTLAFEIPFEDLAILNVQNEWVVEPGRFTLYVGGGSSAEALPLEMEFSVD